LRLCRVRSCRLVAPRPFSHSSPGIVRAIHVEDGDHVTAGQILIELDQPVTGAERVRTARDLMIAKLDVARLAALRSGMEAGGDLGDFDPPADSPEREVRRAHAAMTP
jgi:hemolysin D